MGWAAESHKTHTDLWLTTPATYKCPGLGEVAIQVILGGIKERDVDDTYAVDFQFHYRDFILPDRQTLILLSEVHEPQAGDLIEWVSPDSVTYLYEVRNMGDEPVWDEYDRYDYGIRIHTVLTGVA